MCYIIQGICIKLTVTLHLSGSPLLGNSEQMLHFFGSLEVIRHDILLQIGPPSLVTIFWHSWSFLGHHYEIGFYWACFSQETKPGKLWRPQSIKNIRLSGDRMVTWRMEKVLPENHEQVENGPVHLLHWSIPHTYHCPMSSKCWTLQMYHIWKNVKNTAVSVNFPDRSLFGSSILYTTFNTQVYVQVLSIITT